MKIPSQVKSFFIQQSASPFEAMLGFFFTYAAIAALVNFGQPAVTPSLTKVLGPTVAMLFNALFLLSGLGMFFGIGFRMGNIEFAGLALLSTSIVVRVVASIAIFGITAANVNGFILNAAFVCSCAIRARTIWTNRITLKIQ